MMAKFICSSSAKAAARFCVEFLSYGCFWLREEVVHSGELLILNGLSFLLSFEDVADFQVLKALLKICSLRLFYPDNELCLQRRRVRLVCLKH